jgi:hypothetical protein
MRTHGGGATGVSGDSTVPRNVVVVAAGVVTGSFLRVNFSRGCIARSPLRRFVVGFVVDRHAVVGALSSV